MSLILVMLAVSVSLVLTYSFLRTQTTMLLISRNSLRQDAARQAAQTGATVALQRLQSLEWGGVSEELMRTVWSNHEGSARYHVRFRAVAADDQPLGPEAALGLVISSTGIWQSAATETERVEREVQVAVQLQPRVPGRPILAGDDGAAEDVAANPGDYDTIQGYTLFADGGGGDSLVLDPGGRIEGPIWLKDDLGLFEDPAWSSGVRRDVLASIGERLASGSSPSAARHPHPLAGEITFHSRPSDSLRNDLQRLNVPWIQADSRPSLGTIDYSQWRRYRLYDGGFEYQAVELGATLRNVELRPTAENPLGIFYRAGSVRLDDNVMIQGTLVATGTIAVAGDSVHVGSFNWRTHDGESLVDFGLHWPRLPALVAHGVTLDRQSRAVIEGAVIVETSLAGAGADYDLVGGLQGPITGTATARPSRQPHSIVQLQNSPSLLLLNDKGDYAIWLEGGAGGRWYTIVGVDAARKRLTIVGEAAHAAPTTYRIQRRRRHFVEIAGPVAGRAHDLNRVPAWGDLTNWLWNERQSSWEFGNQLRRLTGLPPIAFIDWLGNPLNFLAWGMPYSVHGLTLEPTFHLRNTDGIHYRWSPPLFDAYAGESGHRASAGYRWKVLSWRELR